jgi:phage shock protein C
MNKRLHRSEKNRIFLGVCGGLAEYFDIDPVLVRIIAAVLLIPGVFPVIIAYFILALIMPLESSVTGAPGDAFQENVSDIKKTTVDLGERVRTTFSGKGSNQPGLVETPSPRPASHAGLFIIGLLLVGIGLLFLLRILFSAFWDYLWPVTLVVIGVVIVLIVLARRR